LAALLFTSALYFLLRFESSNRRSDLWFACGFLVVATAVYPFCIWGWFVLGVYLLLRVLHDQSPQHSRKLIRRTAVALALVGVLLAVLARFGDAVTALLDKYSPISVVAFTGFTGDHAGFKVGQFVSFSPFYVKFFFTDLVVFALSLLALALRAIMAPGTASNVRRNVVLTLTTLGALVFVTFFHLQAGAPRYLFAVFPATVVASTYLWGSVIEEHFSDRRRHAYALLAVLGLTGFIFSGSFRIPFKNHGDPYENANFGPTPARREYADFKSAPVFVHENASRGDLLITNKSQYFYFYAAEEADYDLKLGRSSKVGQLSAYMSKTREINGCSQLAKVIQAKAKASGTTWLSLYAEDKVEKCVRTLSKKYRVELVYRDSRDRNSMVYRVTSPHA
jgi:hypothetical protein